MTAILLAALAAVGLFTLLWLGLGRLLIPTHSVHLLLPVKGDGGDLEHNLKGLHWLHTAGLLDAQIDLLDAGLSDAGRERVACTCMSTGNEIPCGETVVLPQGFFYLLCLSVVL